MVIKVKVSDVAKDFGKSNKEIINILGDYCGVPLKKANTVLEENELNILFDKLTQDHSVKNFDAYFSNGKKSDGNAKKSGNSSTKKIENKKHQSQAFNHCTEVHPAVLVIPVMLFSWLTISGQRMICRIAIHRHRPLTCVDMMRQLAVESEPAIYLCSVCCTVAHYNDTVGS